MIVESTVTFAKTRKEGTRGLKSLDCHMSIFDILTFYQELYSLHTCLAFPYPDLDTIA